LLVQDQIPIPVNTFIPGTGTGTGSSGYSVTNAQYLDTGLNLTVTPHINGNGVIRLEIQQEISTSSALETLGTGSSAIQAPRISRRSLSTEMVAPSGATVILGGLISQNSTLTTNGLPIIDRIPFLRSIFGSTSRVNQKSELIILLTPQVVTDAESLDRVTMEVRKRVNQTMDRMSSLLDATLPPPPGSPAHHPSAPSAPLNPKQIGLEGQ
jgi:general secretion pathway protein D